MTRSPVSDPASPPGPGDAPLRHDRQFLLFWSAHTVSLFGTTITGVVLPILVFQQTASAALTSAVVALEAVPYLLFGLIAGAVADRRRRRRTMLACEIVSALLTVSVPLLSIAGRVPVALVFVVAAGLATTFVWFDAANFGALPALVGRDRLVGATSRIWSVDSVVWIAGPAVGGVLATTIGPAAALVLDTASYVVSAVLIAAVRRELGPFGTTTRAGRPARPWHALRADIAEGIGFIWQHQILRRLTFVGTGLSVTEGATTGLLVVYGVRQLGLAGTDARLGLLYSAGAAGALVASIALPWFRRHAAPGRLTLGALAVTWAALLVMASVTTFAAAAPVYLGFYAAAQLAMLNGISFRQQVTPDRLQGRVNSSARMIAWGGQPFGAAAGGLLASAFDVRVALLVTSAGVGTSLVVGLAGPLRRTTSVAGTDDDRHDRDGEHHDAGRGDRP